LRIHKYGHSCLMIEERGEALIFDPGRPEFLDDLATPETFAGVSVIAITHWHLDHADPDLIRRIAERSGARVLTVPDGEKQLREAGLDPIVAREGKTSIGAFNLTIASVPHAALLGAPSPQNLAYVVNDRLLNVGDSFDRRLEDFRGIALLALPVTAPWMSDLDAAGFAERIKPERVLPVHDGYVKDFFRTRRYDMYRGYLEKKGIGFEGVTGPAMAVDV
jgi:L-ascorbate metabolism protein UlaG (beta-lactamase superfamily)